MSVDFRACVKFVYPYINVWSIQFLSFILAHLNFSCGDAFAILQSM